MFVPGRVRVVERCVEAGGRWRRARAILKRLFDVRGSNHRSAYVAAARVFGKSAAAATQEATMNVSIPRATHLRNLLFHRRSRRCAHAAQLKLTLTRLASPCAD